MVVLILICTLVNAPLGFFICYRWKIHSIVKILSIGLILYIVNVMIIFFYMTSFNSNGWENLGHDILAMLNLSLVMLMFGGPVILLFAVLFWLYFNQYNHKTSDQDGSESSRN